MKIVPFKWLFLFVVLLAILYENNRYEIFAVNIQKGQGRVKAKGSFRVMTWNVNAPLGTEDVEKVCEGLIAEIEKQSPDILCLQELSPKTFKQMHTSLDSLFGYTDSMIITKESQRFRIYSMKPIRNFKRYKCITDIDTTGFNRQLQNETIVIKRQMPVYSAEIEVEPDKWITVFSVHLRSSAYSTARRSLNEGTLWTDGIPLYYENYKTGKLFRNYEADNLRLHLEILERDNKPIIIAGDFNDWSGSYCMNSIRKSMYKDSWWNSGLGFGVTYIGWHLMLRLDHILYNHHFRLDKVFVEKDLFSDHYPLVADFFIEE